MDLWAQLLLVATVGALVGCLTGLLPCLHVNTLSVVLLATVGLLAPVFDALGAAPARFPLLAGSLIVAITVSHTFVNVIPGTYLGAPDELHALSVLPAHKMLLRGEGYRAVRLGAFASFFALLASLLLVWPAKWILAEPLRLFAPLQAHMFWILLLVAAYLVMTETARVGPEDWSARHRRILGALAGLSVFLAAGVYGLLLFQVPYASLVPLPPSPLLPALTGLFGAATLLASLSTRPRIPHQFLRLGARPLRLLPGLASLGAGVAAGAGISLLPGLTNASASAVATAARRGSDEEILVSLNAVNTANAVFNLLMLYLFAKTRSGAVVALGTLVPIEPWRRGAPPEFLHFLFVALAAALVSLALTLVIGRAGARRIQRIPYGRLLTVVLAYMTIVVFVFTGWTGLLVFLTGVGLGLVPVRLGLKRTHLTGVLLVPVLSYLAP